MPKRWAASIGPVERNIKLVIAYDGTDFHGWQKQPGMRTVQGIIEDVAQRVMGETVLLRGSGRTDAGVHALGQVANFRSRSSMPAANVGRAIGSRLPDDVSILHSQEVHADFDATISATSKLYRYRVFNAAGRSPTPAQTRYCLNFWHALDLDRLRAAAAQFVGEHDFSSMANAGCVRETMVRSVLRCDVHRRFDEIRFDVQGTGFLYNQVRIMVGTLLEIGRGHWPVERAAEILASRDRSQAGPTVLPVGLCLQWVEYPPAMLNPAPPNTPTVEKNAED